MNDYDRLVTALRNDATDNTRLLNENAMLEADNKTLTAKLEQAEAELAKSREIFKNSVDGLCASHDNLSSRLSIAEAELKCAVEDMVEHITENAESFETAISTRDRPYLEMLMNQRKGCINNV